MRWNAAGGAPFAPIAQLRTGRLGRRLPQLYVGLVAYGVSLALMVRGDLGLAPWDVLHSGLIQHVPITLGQAGVRGGAVELADQGGYPTGTEEA